MSGSFGGRFHLGGPRVKVTWWREGADGGGVDRIGEDRGVDAGSRAGHLDVKVQGNLNKVVVGTHPRVDRTVQSVCPQSVGQINSVNSAG